jgi:hypothetical protein
LSYGESLVKPSSLQIRTLQKYSHAVMSFKVCVDRRSYSVGLSTEDIPEDVFHVQHSANPWALPK